MDEGPGKNFLHAPDGFDARRGFPVSVEEGMNPRKTGSTFGNLSHTNRHGRGNCGTNGGNNSYATLRGLSIDLPEVTPAKTECDESLSGSIWSAACNAELGTCLLCARYSGCDLKRRDQKVSGASPRPR